MGKLENISLDGFQILIRGNEEEKGLRRAGIEVKRRILSLDKGGNEKYWERFRKRKDKFVGSVKNYEGKYSSYFANLIGNIESVQKNAQGYNPVEHIDNNIKV